MTVYDVVLFLHTTSAIIMFASLTVDWLAIAGLRVTWTAERGRIWIRALEVSAAFGVWARLAVLGAGIYLAVDAWSWQGWIIVGLVSWIAFVLLGEPLTGKDLREMAAGVRAEQGTLSIALLTRLHNPRMWQSVLTRVGLGARGAVTSLRRELEYHHVDLAAGYQPADWPDDFAATELSRVTALMNRRADAPPITLTCPTALHIDTSPPVDITGPPAALLAWLSGRSNGSGLHPGAAALPTLPPLA